MSKFNPYILLLVLILGFSCDKKSENESLFADSIFSSEPIFYFSTNSEEYKIEAGESGFYMFSEYEVDTMNVYSFVARFAKLSTCENQCEEELIIKIRDFQPVNSSSPIAINEALSIGEYSFGGGQNLNFSNILIAYTDQDGTTFRTDLVDQNVESYFQILAVSDFQQNENNQPTKKLDVAFRCTLSSSANGVEGIGISFEDAQAVIGVAYPE
ncbi:MAG: hypothetical protein ACI8P3_003458 [Saprospiraceae bacterium]|jgi:hypothetical protein